jgi:APA family basic amino acid/polyamine antiporter
VKDPRRTIPRATIIGTLFAASIYILATVGVMGILPASDLATSTAPFADAGRLIWGSWAGSLIAAGAAISAFGALNGWILLQGQMPMAVARDGLFPKVFGRMSKRGTPVAALVISSILVTGLMALNFRASLVEQFTFIILLATLSTLIPYVFSAVAELVIFVRERERFRGERLAGASLIAALALLYSIWAIGGSGRDTVFWGFLLLLAGLPVYWWQTRKGRVRE